MKKTLFIFVVLIFLASCGVDEPEIPTSGEKQEQNDISAKNNVNDIIIPSDKIGTDLNIYNAGGKVKFEIPKGWEVKKFVYPDPALDLVMAGTQTVFYPKGQDMDDIFKTISKGDFRYQQFNVGSRSFIVFMTGATTRYSDQGIVYPRMSFYDAPVSNYKYGKIVIDKNKWDYCSALITPPAVKYNGKALIWFTYGKGKPLTTQVATSFYGFAFVSKNISSSDEDMLINIAKSLRF